MAHRSQSWGKKEERTRVFMGSLLFANTKMIDFSDDIQIVFPSRALPSAVKMQEFAADGRLRMSYYEATLLHQHLGRGISALNHIDTCGEGDAGCALGSGNELACC